MNATQWTVTAQTWAGFVTTWRFASRTEAAIWAAALRRRGYEPVVAEAEWADE